MRTTAPAFLAKLSLLVSVVCSIGGCVAEFHALDQPVPYMLLPVDETMTCEGIAASFRFSARRAALLEYWLSVGRLAGYGYERFSKDAPEQLVDERRRLDALSDLQRFRGCIVMEPGPAVVAERSKLEGSIRPALPSVILNSRG